MRTLKQLAREALEVQDASNLSGVVHAWSRSMTEQWEIANSQHGILQGTKEINNHAINKLWASKVGSLTGIGEGDVIIFSKAFDACIELATGD